MRAFAEASSDPGALLDTVARQMARAVGGFCAIALPSADGRVLEIVASYDGDPLALALIRRVNADAPLRLDSPHPSTRVFETGEPFFTPRVDEALLAGRFDSAEERDKVRALGVRSMLLVALRAQGASIGLLSLVRHGPASPPLDEEDVRVAQTLANHAALAIVNSHLLASLKASETRLRQIVETAHEGIWVTDAENRITFTNRRMAQMLRTPAAELAGKSALDFVAPEERIPAEARLARRKAGIAEQLDTRLVRPDRSVLLATVSVSSMLDEAGRYQGAVALVTDATERRRLEEQLQQAQKMEAIGQLAGGVAHDFNNLLSVILSYAQMLRLKRPSPEQVAADAGEIEAAAQRAADLTRQILAFSRRQILEPRVIDLGEVAAGMRGLLARLIGEHIELEVLGSEGLGLVFVDPRQVEQVILNLAVNARDAMPGGGVLSIETANVELDETYAQAHAGTDPGPHVMLAVSDNGVGMDAATRARLFEPFFTTKGPGKGTGLGLATVFGAVKQSRGSIWVYSEPGKGTTFKVYFPRTDRPRAAEAAPAPAKPISGSETILVVEDDPQVRTLTTRVLESAGYRVLAAESGDAALLLCERHPERIHLLVTDVVMPRMGGRELARRLGELRPGVRVLYVSGYTANSVVHQGVLDEGTEFLQKPITPEALARKVREVLDAPGR